ncbi:MAG: hypothetical protein JO327_02900, partial [Nitrososphaeraceae archaeon]|nr:hypothetical protein [Nitrososphaeraceae archaeon]
MLIRYMAENSNNYIFSLLTVAVITTIIMTSPLNLFSFPSLFNDNTTTLLTTSSAFAQNSNDSGSTIIRGGGIGSITCPDGSSNKAVIAFVVSGNGSSGKISTTNWNINELPSGQNSVPGFVSGEFNSVI